MDFSTLSNDELKKAGQAWFGEVESRVQAGGYPRVLKIVKSAHTALNVAASLLVDDEQIQPLSGDDKEP